MTAPTPDERAASVTPLGYPRHEELAEAIASEIRAAEAIARAEGRRAGLEAAARGWNRHPTASICGGKRQARRARAYARRHAVGGSGAETEQALPRRNAA